MKPGLPVGDCVEYIVTVTEAMRAQFDGATVHPLYATASMISHMEWAARQHILPYLEPGEEGVGCHVDVKHLAPTPIGAKVRIRSTVTEVTPSRVSSQVEAWNEQGKIGEGTFVQAIVPLEKLYGAAGSATALGSDDPPPAVLGEFSLEALKWETGMFPCTRYDEWLVCRTQLGAVQQEGPFLLRYELEEWIQAMQGLVEGTRSAFQSDFLEPVLNVHMAGGEAGEFEVRVMLTPVQDNGQPTGLVESRAWTVDKAGLRRFVEELTVQLEGFPSRL